MHWLICYVYLHNDTWYEGNVTAHLFHIYVKDRPQYVKSTYEKGSKIPKTISCRKGLEK